MASVKAFRSSARGSSGEVVASDTEDRRVRVYVEGAAQQRIGFSSDDTYTTESGFLIPDGGVEFLLQAGDPLYMTGTTTSEASYVFFLVTKAA